MHKNEIYYICSQFVICSKTEPQDCREDVEEQQVLDFTEITVQEEGI